MAFCEHCGKEISSQAISCPGCGHPQRVVATSHGYVATGQTDGTAIASLILGIAGFVVCPLICSILAVVFARQAKAKIRTNPMLAGEGMAKAGEILGWIGISLTVVVIVIWVIAIAIAASSSSNALLHSARLSLL